MMFKKGANPFAKTSQEPMDLLESITSVELASCVPFIKIEKIDRLGRAATDVRPLMYDLIQAPRFAGGEDDFGIDGDTFAERSLVSLRNVVVEFEQQYGQQIFRNVTIEFVVHHPTVVFDRNSKVAWREILMEGKSFSLEYGWRADPTIVQNPLFNGEGHVTESGQVIKSTQLILLNVFTYDLDTMASGEVKVTVKAKENGDICLREMRFSDAFERSIGKGKAAADDIDNVKTVRALISKLPRQPVKGKGEYFLMGDILDQIIAPMVTEAAKAWEYDGVDLLLGKFNKDSGPESAKFYGAPMADRGLEDFQVPVTVIMDLLGGHFSKGRPLYLQNFINMIINVMNAEPAWSGPPAGKSYQKPHVLMKSDTVQTSRGLRLVLIIHDITVGSHPFGILDDGQHRIALEKQSKEETFSKLRSLGVPILEYARAGNLITDSSFKLQPDPGLQAIQVDSAYRDRKDRVQQNSMPDTESRKGQARGGELMIPISILEGDITMYGNFAMEVFGRLWIEYFGSKEVSGVYSIRGKTDTLEAGKFSSTFKVISEGIDPLNTRRRRTEREFKEIEDRKKDLSKKSKEKPGEHSRSTPSAPGPKPTGTQVTRGT
jgi:hypothetical protein